MHLILTIFLAALSHGETVISKAPEASPLEYRAYLKAAGSRMSTSQSYLNRHPSPENRNRLLLLLADAQRKFLAGSTAEALAGFQTVIQLVNEEDWSFAERQALLYSALRAAQLAPQEEERYLKLSLTFGEDVQPDTKLIPPPLIERRKALAAQTPKVQVDVSRIKEKFSWLLVNGFRLDLTGKNKISLPAGDYRITYVSDVFPVQTQFGPPEEIEGLLSDSSPLVTGTCATHPPEEFFGGDCGAAKKELHLQPSVAPSSPVDFKVVSHSRPIYKNGWLWAGVGVVVAAVLFSQKKEKESAPSTTYGF